MKQILAHICKGHFFFFNIWVRQQNLFFSYTENDHLSLPQHFFLYNSHVTSSSCVLVQGAIYKNVHKYVCAFLKCIYMFSIISKYTSPLPGYVGTGKGTFRTNSPPHIVSKLDARKLMCDNSRCICPRAFMCASADTLM